MNILVLDATTKKITAKTTAAKTATQLSFTCHYADATVSAFTEKSSDGLLSASANTDVDIVEVPGASTQRVVREITIYNADTIAHTLTVSYDDNGTKHIIHTGTIGIGAIWHLSDVVSEASSAHVAASSAVHGLPANAFVLGNKGAAGEFVQRGSGTTGATETAFTIYYSANGAVTFAVAFATTPYVVLGHTGANLSVVSPVSVTTSGFGALSIGYTGQTASQGFSFIAIGT